LQVRPKLPALGKRRRHFGPLFLTTESLKRLIHLPDTIELHFGTEHTDHQQHADHYRRIVTLAENEHARTEFFMTTNVRASVAQITRPIMILPPIVQGQMTDAERWENVHVTQTEHEYLRLLCSQTNEMNLHALEQALWLVGVHERCILFTMVRIWRRRVNKEHVALTDDTLLSDFLAEWNKDVKDETDLVTRNYFAIEKFLGADLFKNLDGHIRARFGSAWNGFDSVDALVDVLRNQVLSAQFIEHVFKQLNVKMIPKTRNGQL
jgi:hypothetical protein